MGYGDPDHHHPLNNLIHLEKEASCFRCELPCISGLSCYGCSRCNHFVHILCFGLPQDITHPLHPQHSLTLLPSSINSNSSQIITENCNLCLQPFVGGYAYHCQTCLKFNLHLKCFLTLNMETKHKHPLRLCEAYLEVICLVCGLLIDRSDNYIFACTDGDFFIHFECAFLPPTVKHRHVHELTFEYNYPEGSKVVDCDVCLDGKELERPFSYYYCENCDYIAHARCVTSQPAKVTTQFDHFIHEHPMLFLRDPDHLKLECAACKHFGFSDSFYLCSICNYALHKSCAQFPRFIKHPCHKESHNLSLQSRALQNKDHKLVRCGFCTKELKGEGWIFQCSDCEFAAHLYCARYFKHPFYEGGTLSFSSYDETKFRCNACGELGDGFRMSKREDNPFVDLHVECFSLPGQIEHDCHSHPLYLLNSPTEIESDLSSVFQCDICHTEADPDFWVYCCVKCKYFAHLKCVVYDLLPAPGLSSDFSNFCSIPMCENEKFRVRKTKLYDCLKFLKESFFPPPLFFPGGFLLKPKPLIGDHNGRSITLDVTDILLCPECEKPISAQTYSSVWDWVHRNLKASIYDIQMETPADNESLALLDEKVVDELCCPICNLFIFPPTYSCADCQIFFHKSCAELPHKYTINGGHTLVLQSPSINNNSLNYCRQCKRPFRGYVYFCTSCEIGLDVTCAMGAPLLKLENQKHSLFATNSARCLLKCNACHQCLTEENIFFRCLGSSCRFFLHVECALLPSVFKHRIHHHPLVLEPHLDLSVDDYVCDVCEGKLNPCLWVYRCSDSCGDRATSHVSCIVNSNKECHFVYDEECSYPHLIKYEEFRKEYGLPSKKKSVPALATAIVNKSPRKEYRLISKNLLLFVDELEHEYSYYVTEELRQMSQAEVFHLMESPGALKAKVAEIMKDLTHVFPNANEEENAENDENHYK